MARPLLGSFVAQENQQIGLGLFSAVTVALNVKLLEIGRVVNAFLDHKTVVDDTKENAIARLSKPQKAPQ